MCFLKKDLQLDFVKFTVTIIESKLVPILFSNMLEDDQYIRFQKVKESRANILSRNTDEGKFHPMEHVSLEESGFLESSYHITQSIIVLCIGSV
jgi:hypothetical protein